MPYYDVQVAAVPTARRDAYRDFAARANDYIRSLGATEVVDLWGDDVPEGEATSLPMAVKCASDETVIVGWITWPDKATRDAGWAKMMEGGDDAMGEMPFDGKRMIFGGFEPVGD